MVNDRNEKAFELRAEGKTLREIGEALGGVSVERARQIIKAWERHLTSSAKPGVWAEAARAGVKTRTANALKFAGFWTKDEILRAVRAEKEIEGIGETGFRELRAWLKISEPEPKAYSEVALRSAITMLTKAGYKVTKAK